MNATPGQIRLAEAIYRCEAHCLVCCELYGSGRTADALLQSARPMTDVFPWLETELRSAEAELRAFMTAVADMGALVRRRARPRLLRRSFKQLCEAREELLRVMFGSDAGSGTLNASIAMALLGTLRGSYSRSIEREDLAGYQTSYGVSQIAIDLLDRAAEDASVHLPSLALLGQALPSAVPPATLARTEQLTAVIEVISHDVEERMGISASGATLNDKLDEVRRLLGDVLESYERGQGPVAARLAASLFVRSYDPIRKALNRVAPSSEEALTSLLGVELRRAINDQLRPGEVADIGDKIRVELAAAKQGTDAGDLSAEPVAQKGL